MQTEYPRNTPWQPAQQQPPAMPPQPPVPQPGIVWMPPAASDRSGLDLKLRGGLGILCALAVSSFYLPLSLGFDLSNFPGLLYLLFILLCAGWSLIMGIRLLIQARRWPAINERRQWAAAYGSASGVPLAEPQPFPNIEALPLPLKINLKMSWVFVTSLFCLLIWLFFSLQTNDYSQRGWTLQQSLAHINNNGMLFFLFAVLPLAFFLVWYSLPQSIEVTAQGLIVRHPMLDSFKTASGSSWKWVIPWSDIRLFAIREGKPGASKVRYELSSPFKVVTFARIVRPRWWSLYRPAQPFGEYNAQMDALLALISAKTGLLLYDVR